MGRRTEPQQVWLVFDRRGLLVETYLTEDDARADAWGPRFRGARLVRYERAHGEPVSSQPAKDPK